MRSRLRGVAAAEPPADPPATGDPAPGPGGGGATLDTSPTPEPDETFAEVAVACRRRLGLTQEELAYETGLSVRSIRKLEAGRTASPRPTTVRLLADAFGLTGPDRDSFHRAAANGAANRPARRFVPAQLPADVPTFAGRIEQLAQLDALLVQSAPEPTAVVVSAVAGIAGVGKSALVVHWGHRVRHQFPDGQLYVDLQGFNDTAAPAAPATVLERLLRALGVPGERIPAELDDRAALWRSVLAGQRLLVVLDNAATAAQVRPLLPGSPGCVVLVTSRRDLASLEATHVVWLDMLAPADAVALFTQTAGPDRVAGSAELVAEVVQLCGRLPLAVKIAASRLRSHPSWRVADLVDRLRDQDQRLAELADDDGSRSVTTALEVSYQQLTPDQQRMYRLLGTHPGHHIEPYAAAAFAGTGLGPASSLLDQLLGVSLLAEPVPNRYVFHDLVRSHARRAAARDEPAPARRAALRRLLDHYRHAVSVAACARYPHLRTYQVRVPPAASPLPDLAGAQPAGAWLDAELANLLAALQYAAERGWHEHTIHIATYLYRHLHVNGKYDAARLLHRRSLAAARDVGNRLAEMGALSCLAWLHLQHGEYPQVVDHYQQARQVAATIGDLTGEAKAGIGIGEVLLRQGRYTPAFTQAERALELAVAIGNPITEVWTRNILGELHLLQGKLSLARAQYGRSRQVAEQADDHSGGMHAWLGLGHVDKRLGRFEPARAHYRRALATARGTGNQHHLVRPLLGLGDVDRLQDRHQAAAEHYRCALNIVADTANRLGRMETLHALGRLHCAAGEPQAALAHHRQALQLAVDLQHPADQARIQDGIAHTYLALRRPERARRHWCQALEILTGLDSEPTLDEGITVPGLRILAHR